MAVPTSYTEDKLAGWMHGILGKDAVARQLNWSVANGDYEDAVDETAFAYGVDDVSEVSGRDNIRRLRAIARRELWRLVMQRTAHKVDDTEGAEGGGERHSQINKQAKEQFVLADAAYQSLIADEEEAATTPYGPPDGGAMTNRYVPWGAS